MMIKRIFAFCLLLLCFVFLGIWPFQNVLAQKREAHLQSIIVPLDDYHNHIHESGGPLLEEQAAITIVSYNIDLFLEPDVQMIHASVIIRFEVLEETSRFIFHLDSVYHVDRVMWVKPAYDSQSLDFTHKQGLVILPFPSVMPAGTVLDIEIAYAGFPRTAENPPWEGGFTWSETKTGEPWIGLSCQMSGADLWLPVKDHPSDRPDSISIAITVPESLMALSNGTLLSIQQHSEDTKTYYWNHSYPIANYAISLNVGPYTEVQSVYKSITGTEVPLYFWALPHNKHKSKKFLTQVKEHLMFFENLLGPYPFRSEKYGIAEAPFLGMEHQTLIAYGAGFENDIVFESGAGFDDLHHHELAHEWWGNFITAYDWKDFWIHEGFATYMQALYAEHLHDEAMYHSFMGILYNRIQNNMAIAPETTRTASDMLQGRDVYMKGAWVLHTLRYLVGEDLFFDSFKRFLYPDDIYYTNHGKPVKGRFTDTNEFIELINVKAGRSLDWFFNTYLLHSELPELQKTWDGNVLLLSWITPDDSDFLMPVEIDDGEKRHLFVPDGKTTIRVTNKDNVRIDPNNKVLRKKMFR